MECAFKNWKKLFKHGIIRSTTTTRKYKSQAYRFFSHSSRAQTSFLQSLLVNLFLSKGQARLRLSFNWSTHYWQSRCPQGKHTSTSLLPSVQLPHNILGFHASYFMHAISLSIFSIGSNPTSAPLCSILSSLFYNNSRSARVSKSLLAFVS